MSRLVFIIPPRNFRDAEYFKSKEVIELTGIETVTASKIAGEITGADGGVASAQYHLSDIRSTEYDGVVFVGGPGTAEVLSDSEYTGLAKSFFDAGKLVAAICIAPGILGSAGILQGKTITGWTGIEDDLKTAGANFTSKKVETDGNIITASGPESAEDFGKAIVDYLQKTSI